MIQQKSPDMNPKRAKFKKYGALATRVKSGDILADIPTYNHVGILATYTAGITHHEWALTKPMEITHNTLNKGRLPNSSDFETLSPKP